MCRLYAKQLSEIYPRLQENNVNMIGVGCEELGGQEFLNGKFFSGGNWIERNALTIKNYSCHVELYYDFNKTIYREMGFKRFNFLSILASLLWPDSRKVISEARALQVPGNFAGDGLQTGGALIVDKGGKLLYEFKQNGPGDHLPNNKILQILGLSEVESADGTIKQAECDDVQCTK